MRQFETGATRDNDDGKLEFAGFLSSTAIREFAKYMHENRVQSDGKLRNSDNWKKGIPTDAYMHSMWRHFWDVWHLWETGKLKSEETITALCALMFNVQGMLHELAKEDANDDTDFVILDSSVINFTDPEWYPEDEDEED